MFYRFEGIPSGREHVIKVIKSYHIFVSLLLVIMAKRMVPRLSFSRMQFVISQTYSHFSTLLFNSFCLTVPTLRLYVHICKLENWAFEQSDSLSSINPYRLGVETQKQCTHDRLFPKMK